MEVAEKEAQLQSAELSYVAHFRHRKCREPTLAMGI